MHTGLTLITNRIIINRNLEDIVNEALAGGVDTVVLREKDMDTGSLYKLAVKIKTLTTKFNKSLIINDRIDIALAVNADGVHLGQNSIPVDIARNILGNKYVIGVSTHNLEEAITAQNNCADYIFLGHIFATQSKPGLPPKGIDFIREIAEKIDIPITAIGGIKNNNITYLSNLGITNIAIMSEILTSENVALTVQNIKQKLI